MAITGIINRNALITQARFLCRSLQTNGTKNPDLIMAINIVVLTGIAASALTATSLIPQLYKIIRDKKADDISFGMLLVLFAGLCLWVTYGILRADAIIVVANAISLLVNICVFILSVKYKSR
jgi:MtN3 and saliva related transmembrane protein